MTETEIQIHSRKILTQLESAGLTGMEGIHVLTHTLSNLMLGISETLVEGEEEQEEFRQDLYKFTRIVSGQMEDNNIDLTIAMLTYALLLREYSFLGISDENTIMEQLRKVAEMNESE